MVVKNGKSIVIEDKIINLEYYKGLEENMKDWLSDENDNLFE